MSYRFVRETADYSDFASGAVLHSAPGRPAFPVRLASELFQRAWQRWLGGSEPRRCVLYDPCCGAGYLLAVVALLHGEAIRGVVASDVDAEALAIAERNLALLTPVGMRARIEVLADLVRRYGKESHRQAGRSAERLLQRVDARASLGAPSTRVFQADALETDQLGAGLEGRRVDIVLTDIPYGATTSWAGADVGEAATMVARMLSALRPTLATGAVVVTVTPRGVRPEAHDYQRVERFRVGRREALFWQPA